MQGDTVAFRIDDHRAETMFADLLTLAQNLSTVRARSLDRFVEPAFNQKVNQRSVC